MSTPEAAEKDMGKVYDEFAEAFSASDRLPTWLYVGKAAMNRLFVPAFANPDAKYLDLGSASARVEATLLLENGVPAENMTGVEISPEQVEIAKKRIPGANFMVGDITQVELPEDAFDVVFSHMVFEHLDDHGLLATCKNTYATLKSGGMFVFVVTHPDKMNDLDGNMVTEDGPFKTTAPWGGELLNYRRSIAKTLEILKEAGFTVESTDELSFPKEPPEGLSPEELDEHTAHYKKYSRYPAIRLAVKAVKP